MSNNNINDILSEADAIREKYWVDKSLTKPVQNVFNRPQKEKRIAFRVSDKISELSDHREKHVRRGYYLGFEGLDKILTLRKGYPAYFAGAPFSGKTEFVLEILVTLSKLYGLKHFIYVGETGSVCDVIAELCWKYKRKPYLTKDDNGIINQFAMTEKERVDAEFFVDQHFVILDPTDDDSIADDFNLDQFYEHVEKYEDENDIIFDTTLIDPWNDLVEDLTKFGGREDKFLGWALKKVKDNAKKFKRINFVINHIGNIQPRYDEKSRRSYIPIALPSQWAGGQTWHRRAFTMILIWRPPPGMEFMDEKSGNSYEYKENEVLIITQKVKPKGIGQIGKVHLFFEWQTNCYYELTPSGRKYAMQRNNEKQKESDKAEW